MKFEGTSQEVEKPLLEKLKEEHFSSIKEFSKEDVESVASFEIENQSDDFDYYGSSEEELREKLIKYLEQLGENPEESTTTIENIVSKATKGMLDDFDCESAWVTVRASLPNDAYDTPRWHKDGKYFDSEEKVYKKVLTVKGAQTRFAKIIDKDEFERLQRELNNNERNRETDLDMYHEEDLRIRQELMATVEEIQPSELGESVVYLVGDEDAVVHSEPPIKEPRIFASVLTGTNDQIEQWRNQ